MAIKDELSLSEKSPALIEETSIDVTPEINPETFDLEAFIQGVRPGRRAVTIYGRPDLVSAVELASSQLAWATRHGLPCQTTPEDVADLNAQIQASALDIVVEERSPEWIRRENEELTKAGVTEARDIDLALTARQIVEPVGFTADHLRALYRVSPTQALRVVETAIAVNSRPAVVSVPFSRSASQISETQ